MSKASTLKCKNFRGRIFSHVRPFYEQAVSDLDPQRSMHRPALVAHSSCIERSHMTKNTTRGKLAKLNYLQTTFYFNIEVFLKMVSSGIARSHKKHLDDLVPNSDSPVLHCLCIRSSISSIGLYCIGKYMS
jgi:hypothetical protein